MELEGRRQGKGAGFVTHVFETFLAKDSVEQPGDGGVVGHPVGFAKARQGGGWVV